MYRKPTATTTNLKEVLIGSTDKIRIATLKQAFRFIRLKRTRYVGGHLGASCCIARPASEP